MKNIHLLPTDKPSRLCLNKLADKLGFGELSMEYVGSGTWAEGRNIYITNDEEIKEGDWYIDTSVFKENIAIDRGIYQMKYFKWGIEGQGDCKKIILTTDQDLIKDGVQAIDDDFLEWFVKNPSCESVEVLFACRGLNRHTPIGEYKIIIPKEELERGITITHKQETLEEVGMYQQELFNYLHDLGIIALQSEMQEIETIVLRMQQEQIGKSDFLQKLRATKSDAEARRLIFETFKNK